MAHTFHSDEQFSKRLLIVYNPAAGQRHAKRFSTIKDELERRGCDIHIRETTRRGDAEAFARSADVTRYDVVVAAGGDGTIREVMSGLVGRGLTLGIIPLGTANVLAAELGLPDDLQALATTLTKGTRMLCYPGLANGHLFMLMAGVGFDARVVKNASPKLKSLIGKGAYVWAIIQELIRNTPDRYEIQFEGRTISAASVIIGKGRFYAGRYSWTPDARLYQPFFQVCLFKSSDGWSILKNIVGLVLGTVPKSKNVTLLETDQLRIIGDPSEPVQGDGDIIACLPLEIGISQQTLELLIPNPVTI